jgi:hypothetical protein
MINSINSRKNAARAEKQQRKLDAGFMAARYPEVADIVVRMLYNQRGVQKSLTRSVHFSPDSYALFRIDCLSKECVDGGFDLTPVITGMIRNRREAARGELSCEGEGSAANHSTIAYEVAIQYTRHSPL